MSPDRAEHRPLVSWHHVSCIMQQGDAESSSLEPRGVGCLKQPKAPSRRLCGPGEADSTMGDAGRRATLRDNEGAACDLRSVTRQEQVSIDACAIPKSRIFT